MSQNFQSFFSLYCPETDSDGGPVKKNDSLIIEDDTIYELDEDCLSCREHGHNEAYLSQNPYGRPKNR